MRIYYQEKAFSGFKMFVVVQSQPEAVNRRLVVWRVRDGRAAMTPLSASQRHASLLKQKTLDALTRLGDRDTARVAVHELTRLITSMPPEHLPVVVQCLCDESAAAPKPTARREVLRLFETVADAQREHALPHLPRLVAATIRRMKDPDPIVGDACVETLGALAEAAACLPPSISRAVLSGPDAVGPHFVRPVIDAMHETNSRNAQDVACRALARVFRRCGPGRGGAGAPAGANWFPDGGPGRLALKLASMLSAPNFYAKAALVQAIAALFAAAAFAVGPQLPALLGVGAANANARPGAERLGLLEGESANPRDDAGFRGGANEVNGANGGEDEGAVGETIDEEAEIEAEDGANAGALAEDSAPTDGKKDKRRSAANVGERVASSETATVFPGGLLDATGSHDWPVRRAAAEAITVLLCDLGPGLENETVTPVPLVDAIERVLETRRHDKVKPARDAVCTALSVVDALRRYAAEKLPLHDVAMWRRWVRTELGQDVGSLGEDGHAAALVDLRRAARDPRGAKENTRPGRITLEYVRDPTTDASDPGLKAERVIRRQKLSSGFREANIDAHASEEIIVKVPARPNRFGAAAAAEAEAPAAAGEPEARVPCDDTATAQTPRLGAEGNTYEVASSDGDDDAREIDDADAANQPRPVAADVSETAALPPTVAAETPAPPARRPHPDDANAALAALPDGVSDDEDAPEWMHMAKSIERDGGFKPPAPRRVALPPPVADVGADDVPVLDETYADEVMHFDAPVRVKRDDETAKKNVASMREFDADAHDATLEEMREQMRKMAESQSQVLIRIGDFVTESSKTIAGLTERVESMENTVGAAVSSAATVASAAQRMAERDNAESLRLSSRAAKLSAARATEEVKLALARDRAALEEEKAQLRAAAAQLERAASQLERVVPERRREPEYEGYD